MLALALAPTPARADWATARGNGQRTGNIDGQPGPFKPQILWVHKAQESFVASPVPAGKTLYVSGLGAFNSAAFHAMAIEIEPKQRVLWSKGAPFLKRPVVASPAVLAGGVPGGVVVVGDGMHQTDEATLFCFAADTSRPLWQYDLPGHLVHLEGAPAVAGDKVIVGGGDAGVICVDLAHATLDGKEIDLAGCREAVEKKWKELDAKYQEQKKKDPDFAVPPGEDALPRPVPKLLWQQGAKGKWHVDAPVAVAGDRVVVCSAHLDDENSGKRAVLGLNAADGVTAWETPVKYNPWAGATLAGVGPNNPAGTTALVACSSIRFDPKLIKEAKGEVVALDLASGGVKWRKELPGGVLSPVAVIDDLAVAAGTDGKVRAWDVNTGAEKWVYDGGTPYFAGAALVGSSTAGVGYVADLNGTVHALDLVSGKARWKLNVSADPMVSSPGSVFGSPVLEGGRLYLSTCNLEGKSALSVVVCVGDASDAAGDTASTQITVDPAHRTIYVPCKVAPRKLPSLSEIYPIEVVACAPSPRGQKAHETVITVAARPSEIHQALEALGLRAGHPAMADLSRASGPEVELLLEIPGLLGEPRRVPIERTLVDPKTGKPLPKLRWLFTGSVLKQLDPDKPEKAYGADSTGTLITIFPVTDETVFQTDLTMRDEPILKLETNKNLLPEIGTPCRLVIVAK